MSAIECWCSSAFCGERKVVEFVAGVIVAVVVVLVLEFHSVVKFWKKYEGVVV